MDPYVTTAFSPDGQYLVTAGRDSRLQLWDFRPTTPVLQPSYFLASTGLYGSSSSSKTTTPFGDRVSLSITQPGSLTRTTMLWCTGMIYISFLVLDFTHHANLSFENCFHSF